LISLRIQFTTPKLNSDGVCTFVWQEPENFGKGLIVLMFKTINLLFPGQNLNLSVLTKKSALV